MFIVCSAHIERAIDDFVNMTGEPPELLTLEQANLAPGRCPGKCNFCPAAPAYVVVRARPDESAGREAGDPDA